MKKSSTTMQVPVRRTGSGSQRLPMGIVVVLMAATIALAGALVDYLRGSAVTSGVMAARALPSPCPRPLVARTTASRACAAGLAGLRRRPRGVIPRRWVGVRLVAAVERGVCGGVAGVTTIGHDH